MKTKTINAVISKKISEWLESIDDKNVQKKVREGTIVTGGCIVSMLLGEKVNDFDVYFKDQETAVAVARYYMKKFNALEYRTADIKAVEPLEDRVRVRIQSAGVAKAFRSKASPEYEYFETITDADEQQASVEEYVGDVMDVAETAEKQSKLGSFYPIFASSNAIMLKDKVQCIFRFYGEPEEIHKNYDFVHCTNYWTSWDKKLVTNKEALESILAKELVYQNSKYPLCAVIRTRKFINRGWSINAGQYLKMLFAVSDLDLRNPDVLEEQLVGVDSAYFHQIIDIIRKKHETDSDFKLSYSYLATLIDKIF